MPRKQHVVVLTTEERRELRQLIRAGTASARVLARARVLLKADRGTSQRRWSDAEIAEAVEVSPRTVARTRAAFVDGGLKRLVEPPPPDRVYARRFDGTGEARLVALVCSAPPEGHARWTLRLLADRAVELEIVDGVCAETIRATLKKTSSSHG